MSREHISADGHTDPRDDDAVDWKLEDYRALGIFRKVSFELSGGRYTFFDPEDDFEHARKIAEARRFAVDYFGATADEVITLYRDAVPGFADAIWTLFDALSRAETEDQFAHVALSAAGVWSTESRIRCSRPSTAIRTWEPTRRGTASEPS